ncbi:hypothetical protein GCM10017771_89300 [Streptomyces capitiformicae]|uniref:Uncharacterized protein n=1 Tax=Streptomyces capitiformicae TaxID=2014920 RepID=A0A919DN80_9ACTN|nr:hypothetical protein GCM10017771_89300 [Streptomyces capitiformicae]
MIAELEKLPVNIAWQARMAELIDVVHDYSTEGTDASLPESRTAPRAPGTHPRRTGQRPKQLRYKGLGPAAEGTHRTPRAPHRTPSWKPSGPVG